MSKLIRENRVIWVGLLGLLLVGCVSGRGYRKQNDMLKRMVTELKTDNENLKSDLGVLQAERERLIEKNQELRRQLPLQITFIDGLDLILEQLREKGLDFTYRGGYPTVVLSGIFSPGKATVSRRGEKELIKIGKAIKAELPACSLRVDGYTDSQPIKKTKKHKSNKALSLARAQLIADFLKTKYGFERVDCRGLGEANPIANNKTAVGRGKNRRVEIVMMVK